MPSSSKFEGEQRRRRWSTYLARYIGGTGKITPTRLNTRLGGNQGVSRVSEWLRGDRGVVESTAWDVGRVLRELGADTNELEALWAAGFYPAILRLLQLIAADVRGDGPAIAARLFAVLPARFVTFEADLVSDVKITDLGARYLWAFHQIQAGAPTHTQVRSYDRQERQSFSRAQRRLPDLLRDVYANERFPQYEATWKRVIRGDRPRGSTTSIGGWLRGDDDLVDVIVEAADRMMYHWIPSLMVVRLWRLTGEWIEELYPQDASDLEVVPDIFLPMLVQRQRAAEVGDWEEDSAMQAAYAQWRDATGP
jgi:hypothetical protein